MIKICCWEVGKNICMNEWHILMNNNFFPNYKPKLCIFIIFLNFLPNFFSGHVSSIHVQLVDRRKERKRASSSTRLSPLLLFPLTYIIAKTTSLEMAGKQARDGCSFFLVCGTNPLHQRFCRKGTALTKKTKRNIFFCIFNMHYVSKFIRLKLKKKHWFHLLKQTKIRLC